MFAAFTTVDPADGARLTTPRVLGEWNTAGNFESWSVTNSSSAAVSGGTLNVTSATGSNPLQVSLANIASGPYLDYSYFNYVQTRIKLPVGFNQPLTFYFGTDTHSGFSTDRTFTVPAAQVATDGAFHTYRIDLSTQEWWKDSLHDLRMQPLGSTGGSQSAQIDYVEVGDLPNDTYAVDATNLNMAPGVTATSRQSIESKHFVFWYDPNVDPGGRGASFGWANLAHNALHLAETASAVYTEKLGFKDINHWDGPNKTKFNIISWYGGYWSGGDHLNVDSSGLQDEAPGNPIPHEIGHCFDTQNGAALDGGHWESHANWYREQWVNNYADYFPTNARSQIDANALMYSNLRLDDSRLIYHDFRLSTPLQFYAASLGLDPNTAAELWYQGPQGQTAFDKLASVLPSGTSIKDVVGNLMKYWATLDFPTGQYIKDFEWQTPAQKAEWDYNTTYYLKPVADKPGYYQVPAERAPEKYAYITHTLTPTAGSSSVSVTLNGLPSSDAGADWRFTLIALAADGTTRYSSTVGNGQTATLAILPTDTKVMLQVVATPANTTLDLASKHNTKQDTQDPMRLTYPYELTMSGATPATGAALQIKYPRGAGAFRTNPDGSAGGWVDSTATVASTAYVAAGAQVLGTAHVLGTAQILDFATVAGNATVSGGAIVSGYAVVRDNATVTDSARVRDHATVSANTLVNQNAVVEQDALINGDMGTATITGNADVRAVAQVQGGTVSGTAIADYDYTFNWDLTDGTHSNNYPYDGDWNTYYETSQKKPSGLLGSYRINETSGNNLFDEFGALNAQFRGSPNRVNDATRNSTVLQLDGSSQYAILDRSLAELNNGTYGMWVNPASSASQPLLYIGNATNSLQLIARNASGFAQLTITVGGTTQQLTSTVAVPVNAWTHLAVTFNNGTATFYINGAAGGSASMSLRPGDVLNSDSFQTAEAVYLGRNASGTYFAGKFDDVRVYNVALSAAEVANEARRGGATIGALYATAPATFSNTAAESGVHDGTVRTISAWIKPNTSPAVTSNGASYYQPIVDATDERGNAYGQGLGINNGHFVVRLAGTTASNGQMWDTGVSVTLKQWQQVTLTLSGTTAKLYVNNVLVATKSYAVNANLFTKNYRVGYGQTTTDTATRTYFDGQIYDLRISDRVVAPTGTAVPFPWTSADVNAPTAVGSAATNGSGGWTVSGAGNRIGSTTDQFRFVYVGSVAGNNTVTALLTSQSSTSGTAAKSGVMIRGSTANNAANAFVGLQAGGGLVFTYRSTNGSNTTTAATVSGITAPVWVRLTHSGTSALAYYSLNGTTWTQISTSKSISGVSTTSAQFGLAVTSGSTSTLNTAVFSNVQVGSSAPSVATAAAASPTTVTGTTTNLSVLGADDTGESNLVYTWTASGPGDVTYSANGTNAAKSTTATFGSAGTYVFTATIADNGGATVTSSVTVTVNQTVTTVGPVTALASTTQQMAVFDQFGHSMSNSGVTWSTSAGSITAGGLLTTPASGTATVTATVGGVGHPTTVSVVALRARYTNDSISGGTLADSSGNNYAGTLSGTYGSVTGEIGNALDLTGGYANLASGVVAGLTDFTIASWVKLDSNPDWARIFDFGTSSNSSMFLTPNADAAGILRFAITTSGGGGEQRIDGGASMPIGTWAHVAVSLKSNGGGTYTGTLYVNGAAVGTNAAMTLTPSSLGTTTLNYLGKSQYPDPMLDGSIDDFRIYTSAIPASAVAELYNAGLACASSSASGATATKISSSQINLAWIDNSVSELGYRIERATDAAFTTGLTTFTAGANTTSFSDTGLTAGTTYYYRITALLAGATDAASVLTSATT